MYRFWELEYYDWASSVGLPDVRLLSPDELAPTIRQLLRLLDSLQTQIEEFRTATINLLCQNGHSEDSFVDDKGVFESPRDMLDKVHKLNFQTYMLYRDRHRNLSIQYSNTALALAEVRVRYVCHGILVHLPREIRDHIYDMLCANSREYDSVWGPLLDYIGTGPDLRGTLN